MGGRAEQMLAEDLRSREVEYSYDLKDDEVSIKQLTTTLHDFEADLIFKTKGEEGVR